jgi:hypothetical protein
MTEVQSMGASEALFRITGSTLPVLTVATEMLDDKFTAYDAIDLLGGTRFIGWWFLRRKHDQGQLQLAS